MRVENEQMKTSNVSTTKYMELVRELKLMRVKETESRAEVAQLQEKLHRTTRGMEPQYPSMQRKLKRAQSLAEEMMQYTVVDTSPSIHRSHVGRDIPPRP